ncbi:50S ribosomal protein L18, partial [archaeon]|nr:50S ribosomal protein L18 [archaeon]
ILDIGLHTPVAGSNVFSIVKGALDAGLNIPHDPKVLPDQKRFEGKEAAAFRKVELNFDEVKKKILET